MARGLAIRDVTNKIRNVNDLDVLPISTGDNLPEVIEIRILKNHINKDIEIILPIENIDIYRIINNLLYE